MKVKISLIWRILIACFAGYLCGLFFPEWLTRVFVTFNDFFSQFISFLVPLIILGFVTPAICRIGTNAGHLLLATVLLAFCSTVTAGIFSYFAISSILPGFLNGISLSVGNTADPLLSYFSVTIPPVMDVMSALCLAFITGIFMTATSSENLRGVVFDFEKIVSLSITKVMIPLLPLYIFGIFLKMTFTGEAEPVFKIFAKVILIIFALTLLWLILLFCISGAISRKNPIKILVRMLPAYITALGTSSSAATIPVTIKKIEECGVSSEVAGFVAPLCSNIHMPGSMIKVVACAVTIMMANGDALSFHLFIRFIILLTFTIVAAPGVPGGVIMASLGVLASVLGFGETEQALMIALYVVMDSFGTAANVTGDGAIAQIVNRIHTK